MIRDKFLRRYVELELDLKTHVNFWLPSDSILLLYIKPRCPFRCIYIYIYIYIHGRSVLLVIYHTKPDILAFFYFITLQLRYLLPPSWLSPPSFPFGTHVLLIHWQTGCAHCGKTPLLHMKAIISTSKKFHPRLRRVYERHEPFFFHVASESERAGLRLGLFLMALRKFALVCGIRW